MIAVITYNREQYEYWAKVNRIDLKKKDCPYVNVRTVEEARRLDLTDYIDMAYMNNKPWAMLEAIREVVREKVKRHQDQE